MLVPLKLDQEVGQGEEFESQSWEAHSLWAYNL